MITADRVPRAVQRLAAYDREQNYRRQNGTHRLTGRQQRRRDKKLRHQLTTPTRYWHEPPWSQLIRSGNPARREAGYRWRYATFLERRRRRAAGQPE